MSSKINGILLCNSFSNGINSSRACGCASGAHLNFKIFLHSLKFAEIVISVLRLFGKTLRASCGVDPASNNAK